MLCETEFSIGLDASRSFARLSGDFNPLHVDPIAARRTPYGSTVVHGIHLLLAALDRTLDTWSSPGAELAALTVTFNNPVPTDTHVRVQVSSLPDVRRLRLAATTAGSPVFACSLERRPVMLQHSSTIDDRDFEPTAPLQVTFPPTLLQGALELRANQTLIANLFPALADAVDRGWIADLLATTRLVGMHCPGADSIYSVAKLTRSAQSSGRGELGYEIARSDERFRLVRVGVSGCELAGHIEALFRPPPVTQESLAQLLEKVAAGSMRAQRALVVGGSRGLGELVAKIILAGGGEVTLTYANGQVEAENICAEARRHRLRCEAHQLDVSTLLETIPEWIADGGYTHVYFFASPPIARSQGKRWNAALFEKFAATYVDAFGRLSEALLDTAGKAARVKPRFFYPSTIFLTQQESEFVEYCVAKAAGEALCKQLASRHGTVFHAPRLPRMRTDQTSGLQNTALPDSFPVMRDAIVEFESRKVAA